MHDHEHDQFESGSLGPKPGRHDGRDPDVAVRAALSGRLDALSPGGALGLQRAAGNAAATAALTEEPSPVHDVIAAPGAPLGTELRTDMESRLGHDFGDVRVHTDGAADASARAVNANAYTVGSHVAFQRSAYDPSSTAGRTTLAHELTHVVQQRAGPVDGTPSGGGISVSDPSDRFEREAAATAERAMSAPAPVAAAAAGSQVQREMAEEAEEEPVQGSFLQRQAAEAMEEESTR